jgi:hypothetical protein
MTRWLPPGESEGEEAIVPSVGWRIVHFCFRCAASCCCFIARILCDRREYQKMADLHRLRRSQSMTIVPRSRTFESPVNSNLTQDRYKPHWQPSTYYRYIRGQSLYDDAPREHYHVSSALCLPNHFTVHRSDSDGDPKPIHFPSYWPGYKNYCLAEYPGYAKNYQDSFSEWDYSTPYHSRAFDSISNSSRRGLTLYRKGILPYSSVLESEGIKSRYYERRFRNSNSVYTWDRNRYMMPSWFDYRVRRYFTTWS